MSFITSKSEVVGSASTFHQELDVSSGKYQSSREVQSVSFMATNRVSALTMRMNIEAPMIDMYLKTVGGN